MSDEENKWYSLNREKAEEYLGSKRYEIINLMEGHRTICDIWHIISCEFGETDVEYVLRYIRDLQRIGLIEF